MDEWALHKDTVAMLRAGLDDGAALSLHWVKQTVRGRPVHCTPQGWARLRIALTAPLPDLRIREGEYIFVPRVGRPPIGRGEASRKVEALLPASVVAALDAAAAAAGISRAQALRDSVVAWLASNAPGVSEDATDGAAVSVPVDPYLT